MVGLNQLKAQYQAQYGPGDYVPNVFIQYWSMRVMAYLGGLVTLFALWGAWLVHRRKLEHSRLFLTIAVWAVTSPFLMNATGWMLTENGRQPWIVQGLMKTSQGVSPSVSAADIWISLVVFVLIYVVLGATDGYLMIRYGRKELTDETGGHAPGAGDGAGGGAGLGHDDGGRRRHGARLLGGDGHGDLLVHHRRGLLGRVLRPRGLRLRRRRAALRCRQDRARAPGRGQLDRPVLGRQRGVADRGRSGDLRCLPAVVRHDVLDLLSRARRRAPRPLGAGRGLRVPLEARRPAVGRAWRWSLTLGSALLPLLLGVALGDLLHGLPINQQHQFTGNFFTLLQPYGLWTGLTLLSLALLSGATFLAIKTTGVVADRAAVVGAGARVGGQRRWWSGFVIWTHFVASRGAIPSLIDGVAVLAVVGAAWTSGLAAQGWAFALASMAMAFTVVLIFVNLYPHVMVSTTNAAYSLTVHGTASPPYTLKVMTVVALIFTPFVLAYQAWNFWVFRARLSSPKATAPPPVTPAPTGPPEG